MPSTTLIVVTSQKKHQPPPPLTCHTLQALQASVQQDIHLVLKKRYNLSFSSNQTITLHGCLNITFSKSYCYVLPLFRLAGALLSQDGNHIKTTVQCTSPPHRAGFIMNRRFHFPGQKDQVFESEIRPLSPQHWVEITHGFFAWRFTYRYKDKTLSMHHQGYGLMICQRFWPLPGISLLLGKPYGEETALNDSEFAMTVSITHWLAKPLVTYEGVFTIEP